MRTFDRILTPIDFSEPSRRALQHALAIARWHDSQLTVLHVEDVSRHAASVEKLRDFIDAAGASRWNVRVHVAFGDAVAGILDHATRDASDMIVMGTNGKIGLSRAVLGSVTERVVRRSLIPVLTVPPNAGECDDLLPFDPILCASDFSGASARALDVSMAIGQESDARVILLHALDLHDFDAGIASVASLMPSRIDRSEFRKDALARLKRALPADAVFRCRPETLVVDRRPADAILETADREDVKLIVMGVQSRGALDRLLFGSTTRRVMQAAACPVLSIRASEASEPWPPDDEMLSVPDVSRAHHVQESGGCLSE